MHNCPSYKKAATVFIALCIKVWKSVKICKTGYLDLVLLIIISTFADVKGRVLEVKSEE